MGSVFIHGGKRDGVVSNEYLGRVLRYQFSVYVVLPLIIQRKEEARLIVRVVFDIPVVRFIRNVLIARVAGM